MAQEIYIKVKVEDGQVDQTTKKLQKLGHEVETVGDKSKHTGDTLNNTFSKGQESAGNLQGGVEGIATELGNVASAAKKGGAAMKSAFVSTGIGIIVVLLGEIVSAWTELNEKANEHEDILKRITAELERQQYNNNLNLELIKLQNDEEIKRAKIAGKSEEEITAIRRKGIEQRIAALQQASQEAFETEKTAATQSQEAYEKAQQERIKLEQAFYNEKQRLRNFDLDQEVAAAEAKRNGKPAQDRSGNTAIETLQAQGAKEIEVSKLISDEKVKILENEMMQKLQLVETTAEEQKKIDQAVNDVKLSQAANTLALLSQMVEKDSVAGKAFAAASTVISGIQGVQNAYTTAQNSPITTFFPAYPIIQAGLAGAFSALQLKKILSVDPTGKQTPNLGGGAGAGGQAAPSFNVVGTSGVNQIAETLGQDQQPVQAYVVGSNVTSQQALDRNIVETATIG